MEGHESSLLSVSSGLSSGVSPGVPQGSVLGPSLFLVYYVYYDIGRDLESLKIRPFADNAFLYAVNSHSDVHCFQKILMFLKNGHSSGRWVLMLRSVKLRILQASTMQLHSIIS